MKGTILGGNRMKRIQTPSNCMLKTNMSIIMSPIGTYAMTISKMIFDAQ